MKKDELIQVLRSAKQASEEVASKGRRIVKEAQYTADLASCSEEFIAHFPDDSFLMPREWDAQIAVWSELNARASIVVPALEETAQSLTISVNSSSIATTTVISLGCILKLPPFSQNAARITYEKYERLIEQSDFINEIEIELRRLGLISSIPETESPLTLLQQSKQAFDVPSGKAVSPSAVLIPLREAINRAVADLLQRRPKQENAGNLQKKILSIFDQCSRPSLDRRQIEQIAQEAHDLNGELSESKQNSMTRDRVRELINRGFVFFSSFLKAIDETKMRE